MTDAAAGPEVGPRRECGPMSDVATNAATKGADEWVWRVST
jgi:hypothetical protein